MNSALRHPNAEWIIAGIAAAGLLTGAVFDGNGAARGLMVGWMFWISVTMGAAVLLSVHALTGGEWGTRGRLQLASAAAITPLLALLGVVLMVWLQRIYPWAGQRDGSQLQPYHLTVPAFAVRQAVVLATWAVIAMYVSSARRISRRIAALALLGYGVTATIFAADWLMSLDPGWNSTAFGTLYGVTSVLGALALISVSLYAEGTRRPPTGEFRGMMLAAMLGTLYFAFMQFLVIWSGNLPEQIEWYVSRSHGAWRILLLTALLLGAVVPLCVLLVTQARRNAPGVAGAGLCVLVGLYLHLVWQTAPAWQEMHGWALILAPVAIGAACIALFRERHIPPDPVAEEEHR